jgi:hypothetical protein
MANRFDDIGRRKQALIEKAARDRAELARSYGNIQSPFQLSSRVLGISRALKNHPMVAASLSSFLVSGYAGKALGSASKMLQLWKLGQPVWSWLRKRRQK